ncbi:MAG: sugar phosphate isomerase/epimerase family protein [Bryobacterales bacterium]
MANDYSFRLSVCNELFEQTPFAEQCREIKKAGWHGIEIAPFTLETDATTLPAARRREVRDIIVSEGLEFVGLHWLTVGPTGLHVTTPDEAVRRRSWEYVRGLVDLCAALRANDTDPCVMVFGSPNQRKATGGLTSEQAKRNYIDGVRGIANNLEELGVTLCVEALPIAQCDVILTLDEAVEVVRAIGSPAVQTMFDSHNAIDEAEPHAAIVQRHWSRIRHIHVNELDGSYPRPDGGYDFRPVLQVAKDRDFPGWVSMEVFDFAPGASKIVNESIQYLKGEIEQLN